MHIEPIQTTQQGVILKKKNQSKASSLKIPIKQKTQLAINNGNKEMNKDKWKNKTLYNFIAVHAINQVKNFLLFYIIIYYIIEWGGACI